MATKTKIEDYKDRLDAPIGIVLTKKPNQKKTVTKKPAKKGK